MYILLFSSRLFFLFFVYEWHMSCFVHKQVAKPAFLESLSKEVFICCSSHDKILNLEVFWPGSSVIKHEIKNIFWGTKKVEFITKRLKCKSAFHQEGTLKWFKQLRIFV